MSMLMGRPWNFAEASKGADPDYSTLRRNAGRWSTAERTFRLIMWWGAYATT
jgi:hypothetical protein